MVISIVAEDKFHNSGCIGLTWRTHGAGRVSHAAFCSGSYQCKCTTPLHTCLYVSNAYAYSRSTGTSSVKMGQLMVGLDILRASWCASLWLRCAVPKYSPILMIGLVFCVPYCPWRVPFRHYACSVDPRRAARDSELNPGTGGANCFRCRAVAVREHPQYARQ